MKKPPFIYPYEQEDRDGFYDGIKLGLVALAFLLILLIFGSDNG